MVVDRNSDIMGTINSLIEEMKAKGMDVYYRDWVGIIQGYSPIYKSQVGWTLTAIIYPTLILLNRSAYLQIFKVQY